MPHSILLGRAQPAPGEPLFLDMDRDLAVALIAEEAATCPKCGLPVAICSNPDYQFGFIPTSRRCWASQAIAQKRDGQTRDGVAEHATVYGARLRPGLVRTHPDLDELDATQTGGGPPP